ncbi:MAG TPA: polysaccharide biosynthesis/export family protein, partial [Azospirillaceae bacterium]|nr:polysaccharide biosynthesis/export family protein [Azospirillaceae bacterium]
MLAAACRFLVRLALVAAPCLWADGFAVAAPADAAQTAAESASAIEAAFSSRAGVRLDLFGYDVLAAPGGAPPPAQGAVASDQLLGIGDELAVTVRGSRNHHGRYGVNTDGLLLLPDLPPFKAAGRTLGEVRRDVAAAYAANQILADVFVYLTETRRISVLVLGEAVRPGRRLDRVRQRVEHQL